MRVAIIVKPNNGCCFYRSVLPLEFIPWNKEEDNYRLFLPDGMILSENQKKDMGTVSEVEAYNPDIIFYNRDVPGKDILWVKEQQKKGVKIVVDVDDYWELNVVHPMHAYWYKHNMNKIIEDHVVNADLVIATTEILYNKVKEYNKNCIIIPNAVPFGKEFYTQKGEKPLGKMNFLYAGGSTHAPDIALLRNKFERIGGDKSITDKAIFTLAGFNPLKDRHCEWDKMASVFSRTKSYQIWDTLPIQEHMSFYDKADVVLVPLVKNEFNKFKSELKIIEAATRELPCIVSDVMPYSTLKGLPGIFYEDWQKNIKFCLNNQKEVISLGKQLAEKIKEKYDIHVWSITRYQLFKHLIKK